MLVDMSNSPGGGRESPSSTASSKSNTASTSGSVPGSVGSVGSGGGTSGGGGGGGNGGCRYSGASFDSGRATATSSSTSTTFQGSGGPRSSGLSSESSLGSFRHSYHSSNSSLGSIPSEEIRNFDVAAMISQGVPDHEILNAWLTGLHLECYYQNFTQAGYDMHTISRMTPEDLNAIGVTKPHHRKKIKSEISQLNISEGLPDYIPESVDEWLRLLRLEEYLPRLLDQGYRNVRQVTNLTWEDLDDIGILKLGHQKKFMLALKRVQDIVSGKRVPNSSSNYNSPISAYGGGLLLPSAGDSFQLSHQPQLRHLLNSSSSMPYHNPHHSPHSSTSSPPLTPPVTNSQGQVQCQVQGQDNSSSGSPYLVDPRHQIVRNMWPHPPPTTSSPSPYQTPPPPAPPTPGSTSNAVSHRIQVHHHPPPPLQNSHPQPQPPPPSHERIIFNQGQGSIHPNSTPHHHHPQQALYHPEVISIRVKNGHPSNSLDSPPEEEPIYGTTSSFFPTPTPASQTATAGSTFRTRNNSGGGGGSGYKSFEDGETTPGTPGGTSNLSMTKQSMSNTWTLPRLQKHKPISKVMGGGSNNHCDSGSSSVSYPINPGPFAPQQMIPPVGPTPPPAMTTTQQMTTVSTFAKCQPPPPPRRSSCSSLGPSSGSDEPLPPPPREGYSNGIGESHGQDLMNGRPESYKMYGITSSSNYYTQQRGHKMGMTSSPGVNGPSTGGVRRSTLPLTKSRDPSPSDFPDPGVGDPTNGFSLCKAVRRNGSDASFKSNSSTESESLPFANDNAGTIKQQKPATPKPSVLGVHNNGGSGTDGSGLVAQDSSEDSNVLSDIGTMLADLTDQLDAILEQERTSKT